MEFSVDFTSIINTAIDLFNNLFPIFVWPLGLILGIGVLGWMYGALSKVFKGLGKGG